MYTNHFGFQDIPFQQLNGPRHVYMSLEFESARAEVLEAIAEDAGVVLLTGHAGTGKTKLLRHLHAYLEPSRPICYLPFSPLQIETFIGQAAVELGIDIDPSQHLFDSFQDGLTAIAASAPKPVLLIDDAHSLGYDVLENLVDLFAQAPGEEPLAQLVLAAHPEIEYTLERPELKELAENMARLSRLQPLAAEDVGPYIMFALRAGGYDGDPVFTQEAARRVAAQTRGVPKLVNTLCEACFQVAHARDQNPITPDIVDAAVEEVAGFAMGEPVEDDMDWIVDELPTVETERMPGIVQAWLKRSRRWPIAAVGVGGTVAATAVVVLLSTLPFSENAANARIRSENTALLEQMERLRSEVRVAHQQRDNLQAQLDYQKLQRDELQIELDEINQQTEQMQAALKLEAEQVKAEKQIEQAPAQTTAEALLAELMHNAETETLQYSGELPVSAPDKLHTVVKGDTLWNISQSFGLDVAQLRNMNDLSADSKIVIGQKLRVAATTEQTASASTAVGADATDAWYTVRSGDSLYGIGREFDSSVDDLRRWNQLADAKLMVGQRLRVAQ